MPYISRKNRAALDPIVDGLTKRLRDLYSKKGDVNYCITRTVLEVLNKNNYASLSDCVSVLRDAADEIQRRMLGPYEDTAIAKNGDMQCFAPGWKVPAPPVDPQEFKQEWQGEPSPESMPKPTGHECCSCSELGPDKCGNEDCACERDKRHDLPPIKDALRQEQFNKIDEERQERFRQLKEHSENLKKGAQ